MKNVIKLIALSLVLVMTMAIFASCGDKSGAIKTAFENEGYTVTTSSYEDLSSTAKGIIETILDADDEQIEELNKYEIIVCNKGLSLALVIKFPSTGDLESFLTTEDKDGNKNTDLYEDLKEDGAVNGNCLILTLSSSAIDIFKNA
ncbi:MAG: hypothetical protein IJW92_07650 [Clostridia bacterium]|nr:hypothetical protein [Clostridia bacterium]